MKTYETIHTAVQAAFEEVFGLPAAGEDADTPYSPDDEAKAQQLEQAVQAAVGLPAAPKIFHFVSGVNVHPASINSVAQQIFSE